MPASPEPPVIVWLRRDLRLSDNPAIDAALSTGQPIIFLFIRDQSVEDLGSAPKWRLGLSLEDLSKQISLKGGALVLRSGDPLSIIPELVAQSRSTALHYCREYTPKAITRDTQIKSYLSQHIDVTSHNGSLLFEPWTVKTGGGSFYKVYTPFWKAVRDRVVSDAIPAVNEFPSPPSLPHSEHLDDWALGAAMNRGASVVGAHVHVGEAAAQLRLQEFIENRVSSYKSERDRMDKNATSGLSENLAYGEISPRQMWHAGRAALLEGAGEAEHFLKELVWREFAYHLLFHSPHILDRNWREGWESFPWRNSNQDAEAWKRGETGEPIVDAAMRELYVTGTMHNRARMIVASYLTKHLMVHWKVGMDWFAECLVDWDPASNAMGWQWTAGCGPDASPFFRIFNPQTQAEKFDPNGTYRDRFLNTDNEEAAAFFEAIPRSWKVDPERAEIKKLVELKAGRERALDAYQKHRNEGAESSQSLQEEQA